MQMTYVGAPMIYYGDEIGMWGANDPDCRKPMVWEDLSYEAETYYPDQSTHDPDEVQQNKELRAHYKKLISIRNEHAALQSGSYRTILADNEKDVFGFKRVLGDDEVIVLLGNSDQDVLIRIPDMTGSCYNDLLNDEEIVVNEELLIERKWGRILVKCK